MEITFVNHASFILERGPVRLICDPWLEGTAFDNGWALLSPTQLSYADFEHITHIWFSHEHPDHFAPPNLLKIPEEYRRRITVLFQETTDRKVASFCRKIGFKELIELKQGLHHPLGEDLSILCNAYTDGDSYALFKSSTCTVLNLNDCVVDTPEKAAAIARAVGPVDVLFTQFGYANKVGNTADVATREAASREKLERIRHQAQQLKPKGIVPFASFVYFCHAENRYMNEGMNAIDRVHEFITNTLRLPCVVLYPGDRWKPASTHDAAPAIVRYMADLTSVPTRPTLNATTVDVATLLKNGAAYTERLRTFAKAHAPKVAAMHAKIHVTDLEQTFQLSGSKGLEERDLDPSACDVSLGSEALNYCFQQLWGGDTLNVNARFQVPAGGDYRNFRMFGVVASIANRAEDVGTLFPSLRSRITGKLKRILGA